MEVVVKEEINMGSINIKHGSDSYNFESEELEIDGVLLDVKKAIAKQIFGRVVLPAHGKVPFVTGRYVSSHRLGIGAIDSSYESSGANSLVEAQGKAIKQLDKLDKITLDEDVFISNSVEDRNFHYAGMIEYSGWTGKRGGIKGPFMIYENAYRRVLPEIDGIIQRAIDKHTK
jgi:hypothetical protein